MTAKLIDYLALIDRLKNHGPWCGARGLQITPTEIDLIVDSLHERARTVAPDSYKSAER